MAVENNDKIANAIKHIVSSLMDRVMDKVLIEDPFIVENHRSSKPLYAALVPDEIFKGSHFERRFTTPFGNVWEKLAHAVALEAHGSCERGHLISGTVGKERLRRIQETLNGLEFRNKSKKTALPNWSSELKYILEGGGEQIPVYVNCDIYVDSKTTSKKYAFELKAPLPNSDQTKVSKEKMFKLLSMSPKVVDYAYYALPYNPYGKKHDYKWSYPKRWFNMLEDESVLIGDEFWDLIGGLGTYKNFVNEINTLGNDYKERIYREFLLMAPPDNIEQDILK